MITEADLRTDTPHWTQKVKAKRTTAANSLSITRVSALHALCQNLPPKKTSKLNSEQSSSENHKLFRDFFLLVFEVRRTLECTVPSFISGCRMLLCGRAGAVKVAWRNRYIRAVILIMADIAHFGKRCLTVFGLFGEFIFCDLTLCIFAACEKIWMISFFICRFFSVSR